MYHFKFYGRPPGIQLAVAAVHFVDVLDGPARAQHHAVLRLVKGDHRDLGLLAKQRGKAVQVGGAAGEVDAVGEDIRQKLRRVASRVSWTVRMMEMAGSIKASIISSRVHHGGLRQASHGVAAFQGEFHQLLRG